MYRGSCLCGTITFEVSGLEQLTYCYCSRCRKDSGSADAADIAAVQSHLEEFLGLPVRINADADPRSGSVTIRYRTLDQLDLICQRLTGGGI